MGQVRLIVEGMTASGKTTTVDLISRRLGLSVMPEEFRDPYDLLRRFHHDRTWALPMQLQFLVTRFAQYLCASEEDRYVLDRSVFGDRIYAGLYHRLGYFSGQQFQTYLDLYHSLLGNLKDPKLILVLRCPLETVLERIRRRGREDELAAGEDYWRALHRAYEGFLEHLQDEKPAIPTLVLDTGSVNLVEDPEAIETFLGDLKERLG